MCHCDRCACRLPDRGARPPRPLRPLPWSLITILLGLPLPVGRIRPSCIVFVVSHGRVGFCAHHDIVVRHMLHRHDFCLGTCFCPVYLCPSPRFILLVTRVRHRATQPPPQVSPISTVFAPLYLAFQRYHSPLWRRLLFVSHVVFSCLISRLSVSPANEIFP